MSETELERLTTKRTLELCRLNYSLDTFIRYMGWIESVPPKKPKVTKKPKTKEEIELKVDEVFQSVAKKNASEN